MFCVFVVVAVKDFAIDVNSEAFQRLHPTARKPTSEASADADDDHGDEADDDGGGVGFSSANAQFDLGTVACRVACGETD